MSERRLPWSPSEKALLRTVLADMPLASLLEITQVFNNRNFRYRSEYAVKVVKRKLLGPQTNSGRSFVSPPQPPPEESLPNLLDTFSDVGEPLVPSFERLLISRVKYDWSSIETGIFLPLHPLIADARRHSAYSLMPDYTFDVSVATDWLLVLCTADISELECSEEDKRALKDYLDCISCVNRPRRVPQKEFVPGL